MTQPITPNDFNAIIPLLHLRSVRLTQSLIKAIDFKPDPPKTQIDLTRVLNYVGRPDGFDAFVHWTVTFKDVAGTREVGAISAKWCATYSSTFTPADPRFQAFFAIFSETTLMLSLWPYMREYVQSSTTRMGWELLTLPLLLTQPAGAPGSPAALLVPPQAQAVTVPAEVPGQAPSPPERSGTERRTRV